MQNSFMQFRLLMVFGLLAWSIPSWGHVHLKYPVGGESFQPGEAVLIRWEIEIPHDQKDWDLYFSTDGGSNWQTIIEDLPVVDTSYMWIVPGTATTHAKILIIQDNTLGDYDDNSGEFTIAGATSSRHDLLTEHWQIYPNPAVGQDVHIIPAELLHPDLQAIYLTDIQGRKVWQGNPRQESWILPRPVQAGGLYFLVARYPRELRQQKITIIPDH